jgi:uncharacterized protein YecE (DUF72 family)
MWPDWVGAFYPPGTPNARMLRHYSTQFPFVEINSTFYRTPTPGQLARMAARTPPGFRFSLKVPRTISHDHSIHDLRPFRLAADELAARQRLTGLVLQFPETFHDTPRNRDWVERVSDGLRAHPTWVEFRHVSWHRPHLGDWLHERGLELASVDVPDIAQLYPRATISPATTSAYVRFHSRDAGKWLRGGPSRYDFDYPDEVLRDWVELLNESSSRLTSVHLVFNNCHRTQGINNARRMAAIIRTEAPAFHVVDPPAVVSQLQATLFDE